jgi:predicted DNA-binding transcriptional regulator AlpA
MLFNNVRLKAFMTDPTAGTGALSPLPESLKAGQAAALLRMARPTFKRAVQAGHIPPGVRLSERVVVWPRAQLEALLTRPTTAAGR